MCYCTVVGETGFFPESANHLYAKVALLVNSGAKRLQIQTKLPMPPILSESLDNEQIQYISVDFSDVVMKSWSYLGG